MARDDPGMSGIKRLLGLALVCVHIDLCADVSGNFSEWSLHLFVCIF